MSGYALTPAAKADLEGIWDFTESRWGQRQAEIYVLAIRDACADLAAGRRRGQDASSIRPGYRKQSVGSHVLFYRMGPDDIIEAIRILPEHGRSASYAGKLRSASSCLRHAGWDNAVDRRRRHGGE